MIEFPARRSALALFAAPAFAEVFGLNFGSLQTQLARAALFDEPIG